MTAPAADTVVCVGQPERASTRDALAEVEERLNDGSAAQDAAAIVASVLEHPDTLLTLNQLKETHGSVGRYWAASLALASLCAGLAREVAEGIGCTPQDVLQKFVLGELNQDAE